MDFLNNFNPKISSILKITGLAIVGVIVIVLLLRLIGSSFNSILPNYKSSMSLTQSDSGGIYGSTQMMGESSSGSGWGSAKLSTRNVATSKNAAATPAQGEVSTGDTAEAYEVTEYSTIIETRKLDETCDAVANLKIREDIIFESSGKYDKGCNYVFKVKQDKANEILGIIKKLDPKYLNENIYTIKGQIDDFTSETDILKNKLSSIDQTLDKAVSAYDEVTKIATKVKDVESLAKIIDSKINIIERLTQERININSQLESIQRSKAEQMDRLDYTFFRVNIYENKFIDGKGLVDSWKIAIKEFINDINKLAQDITVNLVVVLLKVFQVAIYLFIFLVIIKYGWKLGKYIWNK